jgi:poly(hydroxyalkanoate) depolymerase family esterase
LLEQISQHRKYVIALLYPQQTRANIANTCFNWFVLGDIQRDQGEAFPIRQMIETAISRYDIDRSRVFITGLLAGGAVANVLLATNPDLFAGGASVAGLPYGAAATVPEAFDRMRGHSLPATDDGRIPRAIRIRNSSSTTRMARRYKSIFASDVVSMPTRIIRNRSDPTEVFANNLNKMPTNMMGPCG